MGLLSELMTKVGIGRGAIGVSGPASVTGEYGDQKPQKRRIKVEPILAIEQNMLVMLVKQVFDDVPSWVEWNPDDFMFYINSLNGDSDYARIDLKPEHLESLTAQKKILLISNEPESDGNRKMRHYLPFLEKK